MLSESQERMLLVARPEHAPDLTAVFDKWDVACRVVGEVTDTQVASVTAGSDNLAAAPVAHLADAPRYRLTGQPSPADEARRELQLADIPMPADAGLGDAGEILIRLLGSPNIASKRPVYRQYDHQVQTNTVVGPGAGDAAVVRVKETGKAIAVAIDGNGRQCLLNPYQGAQRIVAEVTRNLSCVGAEPLALTDCLNFGNPERPDIYWQLEGCVAGIADACRALGTPVVSGNVSLYNESQGAAIFPTPIVGGLGLLEDAQKRCGMGFPAGGLTVVMLGADTLAADAPDLAGSEYLAVVHGLIRGNPQIDMSLERRVQDLCRNLIADGVALSAHDCSDGGFAVALAESCIVGDTGVRGAGSVGFTAAETFTESLPTRWDAALFGEAPSRILVSVDPSTLPTVFEAARQAQVPAVALGETGGSQFRLGSLIDVGVEELRACWEGGLGSVWGLAGYGRQIQPAVVSSTDASASAAESPSAASAEPCSSRAGVARAVLRPTFSRPAGS